MIHKQRFADTNIKERFPLELDGDINWTQSGSSTWVGIMQTPQIPANHIIVPSYSSLENIGEYQFSLTAKSRHELYPIPSPKDYSPQKETNEVSGHIDCWHTKSDIGGAEVRIKINQKSKPQDYLLTLSIRKLTRQIAAETPNTNLKTNSPQRFSQKSKNQTIRDRICSPTATAMALSLSSDSINWSKIIGDCFDPATNAFGSWPLAIKSAAKYGFIGSVETTESWEDALKILATGQPLVCSIRFKENELKGSPLKQTQGHLVCVYGLENNKVLALDPAAEDSENVERQYDLKEFSDAWLRERGAIYYFCYVK